MAGPWEKYAAQAAGQSGDASGADDSAPAGPWTKYQAQAAPAGPSYVDQAIKGTVDSLPMLGGIAGGILGTPADAISGPGGNIAGAAIGGYLGTAAKNLINHYYDPASAPQTTTQALTQPFVGGLEQGLMQGAGEAVAPIVGKAIGAAAGAGSQVAKWAGTKLLSSAGGVSPDVIRTYAKFSDRINAAPTEEALKNISDEFVGKLASDVETKKLSADQAQTAFNTFHSDLKDAYKTAGYDARDAVTSAQQTLKDAHNARLQQLSGDVYDTINQLKSDVQTGSQKALDVLDASDATRNSAKGVNPFVALKSVHSQIDSTIGQLQKAGTDESLAVADKLRAYKGRLTKMGGNAGEIPSTDAKKLIQGLDKITKYSPMAGAFDDVKNAAFKDIRGALDQTLKDQVPAYRAAMEPVAADADLLGRVSSDFGDRQTAVTNLGRINAPSAIEKRAALEQLGKKYGADFVAGAQPENLPEQAIVNRAQAARDALRPDRVADKIEQTAGASRQKAALDQAQAGYQAAQERLAPFKPLAPNLAGQTQAQSKLGQIGKNIEVDRMFGELGKLTNTDFIQAMKDRGVQAAFQKGAYNGSRNTLFGSIVGSVAGWGLGGGALGVGTGAATGASWGRMVDQWGPALTKKVLDGAIRVGKNPTLQTIAGLELPEPMKRSMVVGLENYFTRGGEGTLPAARVAQAPAESGNRTPAAPPARGPDAWAQRGLQQLGVSDQATQARLMADPKARALLQQASSLTPGSKAFKAIQDKIRKGWGTP